MTNPVTKPTAIPSAAAEAPHPSLPTDILPVPTIACLRRGGGPAK